MCIRCCIISRTLTISIYGLQEVSTMKVIVLVIMSMLLTNSCHCVSSRSIKGNAMQVKTMHKLTSSSVDGRSSPAGEEIHHACPLGNYPCQGMFHSSMESTEEEGGGN
ncbi:hypothetical protein ACQJBY_019696 [Aegilops geniculata]